jgi:hypothetical protein
MAWIQLARHHRCVLRVRRGGVGNEGEGHELHWERQAVLNMFP